MGAMIIQDTSEISMTTYLWNLHDDLFPDLSLELFQVPKMDPVQTPGVLEGVRQGNIDTWREDIM